MFFLNKYSLICLLGLLLIFSCKPSEDDDISLPDRPGVPEISITAHPDDPNKMVVTDLSQGNFDRLWSFPGGSPETSKLTVDTIFYSKAGAYTVTLNVSGEGGGGSNFKEQNINIAEDAIIECDDQVSLLTGECGSAGKCWTWSTVAGAITVGPTYGSAGWFTSTAAGLDPEQFDDKFCFNFEGGVFQMLNNGATVNPWNGYVAEPLDIPATTFIYSPGTGRDGRDQILLTEGQFVGTRDAGNELDIEILTENELVVRSYLDDEAGEQQAEGWFEFYFVAE